MAARGTTADTATMKGHSAPASPRRAGVRGLSVTGSVRARSFPNMSRSTGNWLATRDGHTAFALEPCAGAVIVRRAQAHAGAAQLEQVFVLRDRADMHRWLSSEPIRLAEPHLCDRVRRAGESLFDGDR